MWGVLHCKLLGRSPGCMLQIRHLGGCRGTLEHPWWCCCWGMFLARPPHALPPRWVVQWPQRCPNSGTRQGRLHRHGLELVPFPLTAVTPGQQGVAWQVCGAGPSTVALPGTASPSPLIPFPLPLLLSCLPCAVALTLVLPRPCPQSLAHSVCKEGNGRLPN